MEWIEWTEWTDDDGQKWRARMEAGSVRTQAIRLPDEDNDSPGYWADAGGTTALFRELKRCKRANPAEEFMRSRQVPAMKGQER